MKKKLLILFLTCVVGWLHPINAQAQDYIVGNGEGGTTNYIPAYTYEYYSYTQQIYPSSLIEFEAGEITKIAFHCSSSSTNSTTRNIDVYMANTTKESFSGNGDWDKENGFKDANKVFSGNFVVADGWCEIQLSTPFEYDGTNILVCVNDKTANAMSGYKFYKNTDSGTANTALYANKSTGSAYDQDYINSNNGRGRTNSNQIQFTYESSASAEPPASAPEITSIEATHNSVTLTWGAVGNAKKYNVYTSTGDLVETVNTTSCTIEGLNDLTKYCYQVSAVNGEYESNKSAESCATTLEAPKTRNIVFKLTDSYGDSWNGNKLNVYLNGILEHSLENQDLDGVSWNTPETQTIVIPIIVGTLVRVEYQKGSGSTYPEENSFEIYYEDGTPINGMEKIYEQCTSNTTTHDVVTFTVEPLAPKVTIAASSYIISPDQTATLTATAANFDGDVEYSWSSNGGIVGTDATYTFTPTSTGSFEFTCTATDADNNEASASVTINVFAAGKQFRIKVMQGTYTDYYLDGYNDNGTIGVETKVERNTQIFTIEIVGNQQYYLKTADGYYIKCETGDAWWNVHANSTNDKTPLVFESTDGEQFYIKDYDKMMGNSQTGSNDPNNCYFKVENQKVYCDAPINKNDSESHRTVLWSFEDCAEEAFPLSLTANNTSLCEGDAVELTATVDGDGTYYYTWAVKDGYGSGEFSTVTAATTYFTPSSTGNCVIECSVFDGTSTVEKEITLTVDDMPEEFTIDNQNITINSAQTATFTINYTGNMPSTDNYNVINNTVNEDGTMVVTTKKLYEDTEITYKVSNGNCSVEKTVNITVNPTFYVTLEADTETVCDNGSVILTATPHNTAVNCTYAWSVVENEGSGTFSEATSQITRFTPAGIENVPSQTMKLLCTASAGTETMTDTIEVYVYDVPELNLDKTTYYVTSGETVTIDVKCPEYCSLDYDYYWDSHSNFNPVYTTTDDGIQLTYVVEEDRDIELSLSNWPCSSEKVNVSLKVINESKEVVIGENNAIGNVYLPVRTESAYSLTQQIYTAEELGINERSNINSISFYATWSNGTARDIEVYLANTALESFPTGNPSQSESASEVLSDDFVKMTGAPNFDDEVIFTQGSWTTIDFTTPFEYEPGNNIIVCVNDKTGSNTGGGFEFASYTRDGLRSISMYGSNAYTPSEIPAAGYTPSWNLGYNNQIKLGYEAIDQAELVAEINAVSDTTLCNGENDNIFEMYATKVENATYAWYIGEELLDERREITYKKTNTGTDIIRLVVTQNEVSKEDTKILTINPKPSAELAMENTYVDVKTKFTFPDDNEGVTYTVTFTRIEDGLEFPPAYNVKNEEYYDFYTFNEVGTYMMDVVANSNSLCENSQDEVALITVYPAADFIADNFCAGSGNVTTFNNTTASVGGQVFTWDFGDGSEPLVSNASTVTYEYTTAGDYNVKLTVENGTSSNVKTQPISINAAPVITDITLSKTIVIDEVTFTAEVTGEGSESYSYLWKVNGTPIDGNKYVFNTAGYDTITVTATSSTGCTSEYSKIVTINDKSSAPIVNGNQSLTEIDLGFRPVESWMRPIDIKITPDGSKALRINSITIDDKGDEDTFGEVVDLNYLKFTSEVGAYEVEPGSSLDLQLTHDVDNAYLYRDAFAETGTGNYYQQEYASLTINYGEGEEYNITLKYNAYPPVTGDVVEFAHDVTFNNGTYTKANSDVLANYLLPGYDGKYYDAVYKIELDTTMAITAEVTGTNGRAYIYDDEFGGEDGPGMTNFIGYEEVRGAAATAGVVEDMMLKKGTYYLVAASESANFSATITSTEFGKPWPATSPTPVDYARGMSTELNELQWTFGKYTAEYQVMFGTEQPLDILVDWSADIDNNSCALNSTTLSPNTLYYWQVNAKNEFGDTTGTVWNFATEFDKVQNLALSPDVISVGDSSVVTWTAVTPGSITGYNVLADGVKVNKELITGTTDTITNLGYKAEAYNITVQAVYNIDGYEISSYSEPVKLYVLGDGQVDGYVYAEDGEVIEGASVTFGTKTFTTNAQGYYSGTVTAGTYNAIARKSGYKKSSISDVSVPYNGLKSQDFILPYNLTMAKNVVAVENGEQTAVDVTWKLSSEDGPMFENFENGFTYKWETSEKYPWKVVPNGYEEGSTGYDSFGGYCVKSTNSDYDYDQLTGGSDDGNYKYENTTSFLELTVNVPFDDTISFYYRISADVNSYDHGKFYIDETLVDIFGGNKTWSSSNYAKYDVKAGPHTFRWEYFKDNGNYYNEDAFFIDNISFYKTSNLYNVYLKDILTEEEPTVLADSLTEKEYNDASWATIVEDGIYQWGVSVLYNDTIKDLLNEDFEVITNDTLKELGKFGGPQGEYTYVPDANVVVRSIESKNDYYQNGNSGYYYTITTYYGYDRDVNEEPLNNGWSQSDGSNWVTGIYSENTSASGIAAKGYDENAPVTSIFGTNNGDSNGHYYLISPKIDASMQSYLEFDYIIPQYNNNLPQYFNKFRVVYRTTPEGLWEPLTDYNTEAVNNWITYPIPIELPLEKELYIAFENHDFDAGLGIGLDNVRVYSEGRNGESKIAWSNLIGKGNELIYKGDWSSITSWSRTHIPTAEEVAIIKAAGTVNGVGAVADAVLVDNGTLTIGESGVLTASTVIDSVAADITINAGGQLVHNNKGVMATFVKNIDAYTSESDGWYTISSPLATDVNASDVTNLLKGDFDLYRYDEPTHYWENYEDADDAEGPNNTDWDGNEAEAVIEQGRGYLYANSAATELSFVGELNTTKVSRTLSAQADALRGFNLLGNPFAHDIYKGVAFAKGEELRTGYYTLDNHGAWQASTDDKAIKSGAGFLVQTDTDATQINIDKVNAATIKSAEAMLAVAVVNDKYEDVAYVTFNEGLGLEKIGHMNENIPMVYVPSNFNSFAIATVEEDVTEIPVNFEAMTMGEYTIGVKAENCEYKVMTLVDNLTGVETNLLKDSYTFMATTTDDPDRFLIKLSKDNEEVADSFIYINNGELIFDNLSNDAIINVFDVLGRNVATFNNCGDTTYRVSTDLFADGVYMVRLIEGNNVKVQKMVIE